jgi:hypothetical protein
MRTGIQQVWALRILLLGALGIAGMSFMSLGTMQQEVARLKVEIASGAHRRDITLLPVDHNTPSPLPAQHETPAEEQQRVGVDTPMETAARALPCPATTKPEPQAELNAVERVKPRWHLLLFVNQRLGSLDRLCTSLRAAHINETIPITFLVEAFQTAEVYDYVKNYEWPHGPVQVVARHSKGGLINAIIEGWFPANDHEWGIFLEDDIEVSPYFLSYLQAARPLCQNENACIGVSLYSPKMNELVKPKKDITTDLQRHGASPLYMAQVPCSWGAAYRPKPWRTFRVWALTQPRDGKYGGDLELGQGSGWGASWKRYLLELMLVMDWSVMYPVS